LANIVVGSRVRLKSGGPQMTVKFFDEYGSAYCEWFDKTEIKGHNFAVTSIDLEG
jgi:uncharacterized protein YodC (DUF2158 family)